MRNKKNMCDMDKLFLAFMNCRDSFSAMDVYQWARGVAANGLHDAKLVSWAIDRFELKTTYSLAKQLRDIACNGGEPIEEEGAP